VVLFRAVVLDQMKIAKNKVLQVFAHGQKMCTLLCVHVYMLDIKGRGRRVVPWHEKITQIKLLSMITSTDFPVGVHGSLLKLR